MADGQTKPIKDVKLNDKVTATNPANGTTLSKPVTDYTTTTTSTSPS